MSKPRSKSYYPATFSPYKSSNISKILTSTQFYVAIFVSVKEA